MKGECEHPLVRMYQASAQVCKVFEGALHHKKTHKGEKGYEHERDRVRRATTQDAAKA